MPRDYRALLEDILEAADGIGEFTLGTTSADLAGDRRTRDEGGRQPRGPAMPQSLKESSRMSSDGWRAPSQFLVIPIPNEPGTSLLPNESRGRLRL